MQVRIFDSPEKVAQAAAVLVASQILAKPNSVLGLPTGATPIPVYQELVRMHQSGIVSFANITSFNLDEYCGLPAGHQCSYRRFMQEQLFSHVDIPEGQFHLPDGNAKDLSLECKRYDAAIAEAGGLDLQLLGIGHNGHIGFNEPDEQFSYGSHVVNLTPETKEANRYTFPHGEEMPKQAVSVGVGAIMGAKKIILVATGKGKAEILHRSMSGDITPMVPASILRTHPNVLFLLDAEAASELE